MHCKTVQDRLTGFLEGKLAGSERRAVETHLALCAGCAEMLELMRLEPVGKTPPDLAVTILERTSGSPCERAWEILGDHIDGTLGELDTHLLVRHMNGCGECALLATTLTRLSEDLSVMAVLRPDGDFVGEVMTATLPQPSVWSTLAARCANSWVALLDRPRLSWEAGYVGAIALWLVWGAFGAPINASQIPEGQAALVRTVGGQITGFGREAWAYTSERSVETLDGLQSGLTELKTGTAIEKIKETALTVWRQYVPGDDDDNDNAGTDERSDPSKE